MAFVNVAEWSADHVAEWLKGLDDCILPYVQFFVNNNINGCRLLLLSCDDLNNLNVCRVGHQELILEAVDLLKHLHYNFSSETLQSLALRLGCKSRSLYNQLKQIQLLCDNNNSFERVSTQTLSGVSDILAAVKAFISWIDRYPFEGQDQYIPVRKTILKLSIELASTSQRDQFVEKPNDVIKASCITLAELCERIVQELNDSLAIQPAVLDIVTVKKKTEEELGMHIHSSYSGIHIVGGIKFQSPSHRCGKIEEGDEIIQVNYQTVVGWQLKKLVSSMKEHPTEILLTIKKRPRHSNLLGQVIVLKPYKLPSRKVRNNSNRVKNASTTTVDTDDDDDAFLAESKHPKPVYPMYARRPKMQVKRRATISGASPTVGQPPIRIEDLVANYNKSREKKDSIGRSISHDSSKHVKNLSHLRGLSSTESTPSVPSNAVPLSVSKAIPKSASPKLPYAKVHPFPMEGKPNLSANKANEHETTPKKLVPSKYAQQQQLKGEQNANEEQVVNQNKLKFDAHEEDQSLIENKKSSHATTAQVGVVNPSPVTVLSYQLVSDIQPKANANKTNNERELSSRIPASPLISRMHSKRQQQNSAANESLVLRSHTTERSKHTSRRISCKDLGEGDCQGWLYQRKEQYGFLGASMRWTKRWVVLKNNYLYCYKDSNKQKAECLIHLPGFTVSPAPECKSKKYSFKLFNPNTAFHFASDSQLDMSKWMNKMGLAAISYTSHSDLQPEAFCYSETDGSEDGNGSPAINRNTKRLNARSTKLTANSYRETSPATISTSSSDTNNSLRDEYCMRSCLTSTSSSSTSNSPLYNDMQPKQQSIRSNTPSASPLPKSPLIQPKTNYFRSASCLDAADITAARARRQMSESNATRYAKIVFAPSHQKGSLSPRIVPRSQKLSLSSNLRPDYGSLDRQQYNVKERMSETVNSSNNLQQQQSQQQQSVDNSKRQPPRPLPRTSKLTNKSDSSLAGYAKTENSSDQRLMNKSLPNPTTNVISRSAQPSPQPNGPNNQSDDTYEYVFRPTMAMIKTGIVNPLYDRVLNKSWSVGMTGKGRMPSPNDMQTQNADNKVTKQPKVGELSILDREYNRLYGEKKPIETLSPKGLPPPLSFPKTASSVEIENLYTSKPRTMSSSSVRTAHSDDANSLSPPQRERAPTPSSSDNSMSSSSGISSYYSTYLEIPAEQMYRIINTSQNSSTYHSAKSSPSYDYRYIDGHNAFDETLILSPQMSPPSDSNIKANKSPTKSSSFRLFSSPKLLKKSSTPKYQKERHHEKRDTSKVENEKNTKTGRLFLGSPKLTRALFGKKHLESDNNNLENNNKANATSAYSQTDEGFVDKHHLLNRSSSDSSVAPNNIHHHIIEKKLKPQLTVALPLLTESSTDSCELPLTPETPRKPAMGVAMIGKRRPSNVSTDKGAIELALQQHYGSGSLTNPSSCSSRTGYSTEDTDDEWNNIVRTIEEAGLTLERGRKTEGKVKSIDDEKLCHLVLSLRALQRTLKPEKQMKEIDAIDELLTQPITVQIFDSWLKKYPHLIPQEYY